MPGDLEIENRGGVLVLRLRVSPGARNAAVKGVHAGALKLSVTEPPERGKANEGVTRLLADVLEIRDRQVELVSGHASHDKRVAIHGMDEAGLKAKLSSLSQSARSTTKTKPRIDTNQHE